MPIHNLSLYRLMARCGRAQCDAVHYANIATLAAQVSDWDEAPTWAERQGLVPLLYHNLVGAEVAMPADVRRALQTLALRHRLASEARLKVLQEIVTTFDAADIPVRLLKGAALAYMIYPSPALRPMRDMDILVHPADAERAQLALQKLGFSAPLPSSNTPATHHLDTAVRFVRGFQMSVEVHINLFGEEAAPLSVTLPDIVGVPLRVPLPGCKIPVYALPAEVCLWHLCQHMRFSMGVFGRNRLIWVADIVNFAERFVDIIDWTQVRAHYPLIRQTLSVLHFLIPLSGKLRARAKIRFGRAPKDIGADFVGWPHTSVAEQRKKGWWGIMRDSFFPSDWWLRLYYGLGSAESAFWTRYVRHPLHILEWLRHYWQERLEA